jgi:LysR family nitrogen assimilation transcriptional regulator
LDIRQLRYFIAIAEEGSFSRAAEKLHVAQSALSQHVLAMERRFGSALLLRNPRGVTVTEAGTRLLAAARDIDSRFSRLNDAVQGAASPSGEVRFGMPGTLSEQLGVALIEAGRHRFPQVRIKISEGMSGHVLDWLHEGKVDLALLYNVRNAKGLQLRHAFSEEISLFGAAAMKPALSANSITLAAALRLPLLLPGTAHGLRDLIEAAARKIGMAVTPEIEIDSYSQIKQLAQRGFGFGMLPAAAIQHECDTGIFRAWKVTRPALMREIYLGYRAHHPVSAAATAIGDLSWEILERLIRTGGLTAIWAGKA